MGRKGLFSSAAAGGSLIVASLLLVVAVSAIIGVRGFRSARDVAPAQSVVLKTGKADEREAGATVSPAPVVIGGSRRSASPARTARPPARSRARRSRAATRSRDKGAARARSGLSSGPATRRPAPAPTVQSAPEPPPVATQAPDDQKSPPKTPVQDAVGGVAGAVEDATKKPVESVGDVLLDLRDALP